MTQTLKWIDTHTHLEHEYPFSVQQYLENARSAGVQCFVTIGTRPATLSALKDFADTYADVYFTVGIHPHEAKDFTPEVEATMAELQTHPKCVAVGEIGLDYYYLHSSAETQRDVLARQLELALNWKKPVVIHARDAEADLLNQLKIYANQCTLPQGPGIIHCFSGTEPFAIECLSLGFYLSFSGIVTFKNAEALRDIVKKVPLNRILLETDSPFLAPVPFRGKPNQSAYIVETAKTIAQLKQISLDQLSLTTLANSRAVFSLSSH